TAKTGLWSTYQVRESGRQSSAYECHLSVRSLTGTAVRKATDGVRWYVTVTWSVRSPKASMMSTSGGHDLSDASNHSAGHSPRPAGARASNSTSPYVKSKWPAVVTIPER